MMLRLHAIDRRKSRISELPDDIVVSIVSFLTIKEAIATSILSRGWRHLWKYTTGSWSFNLSEICEKYGGIWGFRIDEYREWSKYTSEDYVTRVNQALESHCGPFLYELRICSYPISLPYGYCDRTTEKIDNWISIASRKCVRRLYLHMPRICLDMPDLHLDKIKFSQLTHLTLKHVYVSEETLCYFLSSSPLLEHLCVIDCWRLRKLKVGGGDSSLKLKHLEISDCRLLRSLEISAPNLVSIVCRRLDATALFKDVPILPTLSIRQCCVRKLKIIEPLSFVSQIESLTLELEEFQKFEFQDIYPLSVPDVELSNLKHLELRIEQFYWDSFLPYTCLLKASPLLSSLKIDLRMLMNSKENGLIVPENWREDFVNFWEEECLTHEATIYRHRHRHQCLRVVTLCGFLGSPPHTELALHLIGMATSLEKMVIDCSQEIPIFTPEYQRKELRIARQRAEELRSKLPPTTEFVVL